MANKMLIDATHPEETRVVVLRGNRVEEFDFETAHRKQLRGNIYLAKVTRVEPSLQAAFVDYGGNRHGFLAFSEIHPDYYQIPVADRQALLAEDERAHRDDEDDDRQRGGGRRQGRHRHRDSRRRDQRDHVVRSDEVAAEGAAQPAAGETMGDGAQSDTSPEFTPNEAGHIQAEPVGKMENSPLAPETPAEPPIEAAPLEAHELEQNQAHHDDAEHDDTHHDDTHHDDAHHDDVHAHSTDAAPPSLEGGDLPIEAAPLESGSFSAGEGGNGQNGHGADHGHDEEEEVVESVGGADAMEEVPDRAPRYRRQYKIQEVIKRRQVMLVQVVKEERGTKGAALTTYLSLAGRYCVLMPNTARGGGISRKITSAEDRRKLREIADELQVPEGMGVILRTAGAARTKPEVKRDFEYLLRMWEQVRDLTLKSTAPTLTYEEGSLAKRSIRDLYTKDIDEIIVAGDAGYRDAKEFMRMLMPSHARNVKHYVDSQPLFTRFGIESQLDAMFSPTVQLRSGGYIVLNQTEALVAIDVNSGRSTREHHIEDTALKTNVEAAEEVARQLRLRDLAGLIVIDFIDMDEKRNNRTVERRMKDALRNDRARIQVGRISHFGLLEMSRQRIRTSVLESSTEKCAACGGTGHVRSVSSVALQLLRAIEETLIKGATHNLIVRTRPDVALYVLNHKRAHLRALEERFHLILTVNSDDNVTGPIAYAVDRGEQVMTAEQAKTLAAQYEAQAPRIIEEEEPDYIEDEAEAEASAEGAPSHVEDVGEGEARHDDSWSGGAQHDDDQDTVEHVGGEHQSSERTDGDRAGAEHPAGERDGRGRRRRRRGRGRGRNGEGREPGSGFQRDNRAPFEPGSQPAPDAMPQFAGEHAEHQDQPHGDMPPVEGGFAGAQHGEPRGNGELGPDGEPRRRRRGRRGGRRNRRDGQGPEQGHDQGRHFGAGGEPDRGLAPDTTDTSYAPRGEAPSYSEPVAAQPMTQPMTPPPAPAAEAAHEPPRRRSTVREAAPMSGGESTPPMPRPTEPAAAPPAVSSAAESDAGKPRKTGWWAKRILGKE